MGGITIDGDLKDWPAAMPRYPIRRILSWAPYMGYGGLKDADLSTSPDLSAAFSVGYDPKEQLIYLAVIVRDDKLVVGNTSHLDTDAVEVYVDGRTTSSTSRSRRKRPGGSITTSRTSRSSSTSPSRARARSTGPSTTPIPSCSPGT